MPEVSTQDIYYRLGQLEGKIDAFLTRLSAHEGEVGKLEERVQTLEKAKHVASGYAAAVGAVAGIVVAVGMKVI
jgi:hypothetical protein